MSGEAVVLMGYPTGIDAVLARADRSTTRDIAAASHGDLCHALSELAKRDLIYPIITQGHLGDVLPDKIIYDAQTTSGGSGGPLFDPQGKVIGINYAIIQSFGGGKLRDPQSLCHGVVITLSYFELGEAVDDFLRLPGGIDRVRRCYGGFLLGGDCRTPLKN